MWGALLSQANCSILKIVTADDSFRVGESAMKIKAYTFWEKLSGSFWFLPIVMALSAMALAMAVLAIDRLNLPLLAEIYAGSPDGVRSLLSTIAGAMISIAGLTFSITIATLALASSQLGPRLLDNFMRDRGNQVALGTFVSIFIYCLMVLRAVRSVEEMVFVPHLSVTLAMVLVVISLGVLIYFFHHVSTTIQAQHVIGSIGRDLEASIERLFSSEYRTGPYEYKLRGEDDIPTDFEDKAVYIASAVSGYLQAIDYEALRKAASEEDILLRLVYRPGDFVAKGSEICAVYPDEGISEALEKSVRGAFTLGAGRLRIQDVEYALDQLVEIAVRALSPGVNDPFTAIGCLDQLGTTLSQLAERVIPSGYVYDPDGRLRVISDTVTFDGIVNAAFDQIRQHGRSDVAVTIRLLEVLAIILARTKTYSQRRALIRQAEMIKRGIEDAIPEENDRQDITERYDQVMHILNEGKKSV